MKPTVSFTLTSSGGRTAGKEVTAFEVKVEDSYRYNTSTTESTFEAAGKVDVAAMKATQKAPDYRIHIDDIQVYSHVFSFFPLSIYLNSEVRGEGQVLQVPPIVPPAGPATAAPPAAPVEDK